MRKILNKMNMLCNVKACLSASRLLLLTFIILGTACSDKTVDVDPMSSPQDKEALVNRVTERWQAMEIKDFEKVYEFETPNYRGIFSKSLYVHNCSYAVEWELTGVDVVNYDARAAVASVAVRVMSEPTKQTSAASIALGAIPITLHEKWFFVNGQWWHSAKD
jgi:hypothetical protein